MSDIRVTFRFVQNVLDVDVLRTLFTEYANALGVDLSFQGFSEELLLLPGPYAPPAGCAILAFVDLEPAGCVALRRIDRQTCEMKRLFVRDDYRGLGIGRSLIERIIAQARVLHYRLMRLDTLPSMRKAQMLYESFGFYDIEPYVYNPIQGARFLETEL